MCDDVNELANFYISLFRVLRVHSISILAIYLLFILFEFDEYVFCLFLRSSFVRLLFYLLFSFRGRHQFVVVVAVSFFRCTQNINANYCWN